MALARDGHKLEAADPCEGGERRRQGGQIIGVEDARLRR